MADKDLNEQIGMNKQKAVLQEEQIVDNADKFDNMYQEQKRVFDLDTSKNEVLQEDSIVETKREMETIATALANKDLKLSEKNRAKLLVRQNRDLSHVFINSKKFVGDSKEMIEIKEKLLAVETALGKEFQKNLEFKGNVHNLRKVYLDAINSCNKYLAIKTTRTRSDRYAMVRERLMNLMDELATINDIEAKVIESKKEDDPGLVNGYGLLTAGRLIAWKADREKKAPEETNFLKSFFSGFKFVQKKDGAPNEVKPQKKKMEDKIEKLDFMTDTDDTAVQIMRLLTTEAKPQNFSKKATDDATSITHCIYNLISNFPEGAHTEMIHTGFFGYKGKGNKRTHKDDNGKTVMNNTMLQITQNKEGRLTVTVMKDGKQQVVKLPYGRDVIIMNMKLDMSDKAEIFGEEVLNSTLDMIMQANLTENGAEVRNMCLKLLAKYSGHRSNDFDNISTEVVRDIVRTFFRGGKNKDTVTAMIEMAENQTEPEEVIEEAIEEANEEANEEAIEEENVGDKVKKKHKTKTEKMINNSEALELQELRKMYMDDLENKVVVHHNVEVKEDDNLPKWGAEEQTVIYFLSDFIYSKDTLTTDKKVGATVDRLVDFLTKNTNALGIILVKPRIITDILKKIMPSGDNDNDQIEQDIIKSREEITKQLNRDGAEKSDIDFNKMTPAAVKGMIDTALLFKKDEILKNLRKTVIDMNQTIENMLEEQSKHIQDVIKDNLEDFMKKDEVAEKKEKLKDPYEKGITAEEKQKRIEAGNEALNRMLKDSITGNSGQGLFIKNVFKSYFSEMDSLDKRSMLSWILRESRPIEIPEKSAEDLAKLTEEDRKKFEEKQKSATMKSAGCLLSGLIKGAGPLFQKMMQGVPTEVLPEELKKAIEDVKSHLLPIPSEVVEAQLLAMVKRSKGEVSKIEVTKSLGAASVGQAFLCKMYGPGYKDGKEVVVKLLRPDVRNRMMREKSVMLKCARDTNEGMEKTYLGMLEQIEKELDLTIEAANVEKGDIYSKSSIKTLAHDGVVAMKLENVIAPTTNSMVIEKAEGTTVDSYLMELDENTRKEIEPFLTYEEKDGKKSLVYENGMPKLTVNAKNIEGVGKARAAILKMIKTAQKRQEHLVTLSQKWVNEGLFGGGFYHGDLHAGNIIINDDKATVIDFGNATQLEDWQKQPITSMIAATVVGDWKLFRSCFHALLPKDKKTEENYQKNREKFGRILKEVLNMGGKKMAGQRIGVALVKAQELGLQLPAVIYNFSQCQLRIQNTVNAMNEKIEKLRKTEKKLSGERYEFVRDYNYDPMSFVEMAAGYLPKDRKDDFMARMAEETRLHYFNLVLEDGIPEGCEDAIKDLCKPSIEQYESPKVALKKQYDIYQKLITDKAFNDLEPDVKELAFSNQILTTAEILKNKYKFEINDQVKDELGQFFSSKENVEERINKFLDKKVYEEDSFEKYLTEYNSLIQDKKRLEKERKKISDIIVPKNTEILATKKLRDRLKHDIDNLNEEIINEEKDEKKGKEEKEKNIDKLKQDIIVKEKELADAEEKLSILQKQKNDLKEEWENKGWNAGENNEKIKDLKSKMQVIFDKYQPVRLEKALQGPDGSEVKYDVSFYNQNNELGDTTLTACLMHWEKNISSLFSVRFGNKYSDFLTVTEPITRDAVHGEKFKAIRTEFVNLVEEYRDATDEKQNLEFKEKATQILKRMEMYAGIITIRRMNEFVKSKDEMNNDFNTYNVKLEDFVDAMGNAIDDNLIETARRVGYFWSYWHRNDLNMNE